MAKVAIFRENLFPAGGIETWIYNLAVKYHKTYDITVYYVHISKEQRRKLSKMVNLREYNGQEIKVDRAIFCFDMLGYDTVKASKKLYVIHADYRHIYDNWRLPDDVEIHAVSKVAQESAKKMLKKRDIGLIYNPVLPENPPKQYKLVSLTRLSQEKGLWRMRKLAEALDRSGISYRWDIYAPFVKEGIDSPNVVFHEPTTSAISKLSDADFLVQLSDTESFGYSMVEAMVMNTGLIVTDIPVLRELNINKDNAIIVPLKAKSRWSYNRVVKKMLKYQVPGLYQPPKSDQKILLGEPSNKEEDHHSTILKNTFGYDMYIHEIGDWVDAGRNIIIRDKQLADKLISEGWKELK